MFCGNGSNFIVATMNLKLQLIKLYKWGNTLYMNQWLVRSVVLTHVDSIAPEVNMKYMGYRCLLNHQSTFELGFFHWQQKEQLANLKGHLNKEIAFHQEQIKRHEDAIRRHKEQMSDIEKPQWTGHR